MFCTMVGDHRSPPTAAMGARRGPGTLLRATALGLLLSFPVARAAAADVAAFPSRPITFVVPFGAGTQMDITARLVGEKLAGALRQPVIVENVPGASGNLGGLQVTKAKPDGYTLLFSGSLMTLLPITMGAAAVDPVASYAPVAKLAEPPVVVVASASFGESTLAGVLERAKRTPGGVAYATSGVGSIQHLAMSLVARRAGAELLHVPYVSNAQAIKDMLAGEIPVFVSFLGPLNAYIANGQMRALAVMSDRRVAAFPDVPTIVELGFPEAVMAPWNGVLAPAGTPPEVIGRLNAEFARIVALPDVRARFAQMGMVPLSPSPEAFAEEIRSAVARWPQVIRDSGVTLSK